MALKFVKAIGLHNLFDVSGGSLDTTHIKESVTTANLRSIIFSTADSLDEAYGYHAGAKYIWTYGDLYDCNNTGGGSVSPATEETAGIVKITDSSDSSASDTAVSSKAIKALRNEIEETEYVIADCLTDLDVRITDVSSKIGKGSVGYMNITYADLCTLASNSSLTPGQLYRITDYVCTTTVADTSSAGHSFDIIVTADSSSILNENARATKHDGDTYFSGCNLEAWELKYCLLNNSDRFDWADSESGKGVIYYMKDDLFNEAPYDFKNIMFRLTKLTSITWNSKATADMQSRYNEEFVGHYVGSLFTVNSAGTANLSNSDYKYFYTFSLGLNSGAEYGGDDLTIIDGSRRISIYNNNIYRSNIIKEYIEPDSDNILKLNFIVFKPFNNAFDDCFDNTFGVNCCDMTFDYSWTYGNIFGNSCSSNTFGNSCCYNTFGSDCSSNTFGNSCCYNTFGSDCNYNTFGNSCDYNTFGNSCDYNTFGNSCDYNTFGNSCNYNTFGNSCNFNTFGNSCNFNTFGNSSTTKSYYRYIIFENGNRYIRLNATDTTAESAYFQNIHIGLGVNNTTTYKDIDVAGTNQTFQTTIVPNNSVTITV